MPEVAMEPASAKPFAFLFEFSLAPDQVVPRRSRKIEVAVEGV